MIFFKKGIFLESLQICVEFVKIMKNNVQTCKIDKILWYFWTLNSTYLFIFNKRDHSIFVYKCSGKTANCFSSNNHFHFPCTNTAASCITCWNTECNYAATPITFFVGIVILLPRNIKRISMGNEFLQQSLRDIRVGTKCK